MAGAELNYETVGELNLYGTRKLVRQVSLEQSATNFDNVFMTEKEIVLETIRALPDDCSLEEIAERIEFMAAVQKGLDQLDRGEGIPHEEVKEQFASWLTS